LVVAHIRFRPHRYRKPELMNTNTKELKKDISDKELRLSQLRNMDTHKLSDSDRALLQSLEREIALLKKQLGEEE